MKRLIICIVALASCATVFAADTAASTKAARPKGKGSGIPLAVRKQMAQERFLKHYGGYVVKPGNHGKIVYFNGQDRVPASVIEKQTSVMNQLMSVPVEIVPGDKRFSVKDAIGKRKAAEANAAIFFVDEPEISETMLVAPESGWAMVNLAALTSDGPDAAKLEKRVIRETWRTFAHLLGAADSVEPKCILHAVTSNADLDRMTSDCFCPEPLDKIVSHLKAIGIDSSARRTYRQACQEGWAPAPTNDYQKAIWNDVYKMPDKPITIEKK